MAKRGKKEKKGIESAVKAMTAEVIEKEKENLFLEEPERPFVEPGPISEEETIADLFSHIPADEGFYIKVYKRYPIPKEYGDRPMFMLDIEQPDLVQDVESELLKLARKFKWSDGVYDVKLYKRGEPGEQACRRVTLQVPSIPEEEEKKSDSGNTFDNLQKAATLIKELTPSTTTAPTATTATDPVAVVRTIADAYKAGTESANSGSTGIAEIAKAVKELAPPRPQEGPDLLTVLKEVGNLFQQKKTENPLDTLRQMKEAGLIGGNDKNSLQELETLAKIGVLKPPAPPEDPLASLKKLKEAGLIPDHKEKGDSLDILLKMKEAGFLPTSNHAKSALGDLKALAELGLIRPPVQEEPGAQFAKALELVTTLMPLVSKGEGGPSLGAELIRVLGPQLGGIVENVTGAINNVVAAKARMPLQNRRANISQRPQRPQKEIGDHRKEQKGGEPLVPMLQPIQKAITLNDKGFYPSLKEILVGIAGADAYAQLVAGQLPVEELVAQAKNWGLRGNIEGYFRDFLRWAALNRTESTEIIKTCSACQAQYAYDSKEEWDKDTVRKCEACEGSLQ